MSYQPIPFKQTIKAATINWPTGAVPTIRTFEVPDPDINPHCQIIVQVGNPAATPNTMFFLSAVPGDGKLTIYGYRLTGSYTGLVQINYLVHWPASDH